MKNYTFNMVGTHFIEKLVYQLEQFMISEE